MANVRTYRRQPASTGRDEYARLMLREEIPVGENATLFQARTAIAEYRIHYNELRAHSALHCLCSCAYYRGDPTALSAERDVKVRDGSEK